jgi:hypothetical protein
MSNLNNGHRERKLKREFRAQCQAANRTCHICRQSIDYAAPPQTPNAFEPDHLYPVSVRPDLAYDVTFWRPSHCSCNRSRQAAPPAAEGEWVRADWGGVA